MSSVHSTDSPRAHVLTAVLLACVMALIATFAFGTDAQAATRAQQTSKAAGQASFFCFAWQCSNHYRTGARWSGTTLVTTWHISNPRNMLYHGNCTHVANMLITVNSRNGVVSRLVNCS